MSAVVRATATATGAVVAVVPPLRGYTVLAVTADAAGRTSTTPGRLVELNLTATGHVLGTGPLPFFAPGTQSLSDLVMSPRGDYMACAYTIGTRTDVTVSSLAGPHSGRTWSAIGTVTRLSWTADEKELGFTWQTGGSGQPVTVRLLDLSSGTGNLLDHSRVVAAPNGIATDCEIITPDGTTAVCAEPTLGFAEFSVKEHTAGRDGLVRILHQSEADSAQAVLWSDASGRVLTGAVQSLGGPMQVGVISGQRFTPTNVTVGEGFYSLGTW